MNDLALLTEAARAAGKLATPYWRQSPKTWEKDAGAGPVTEADLAVDAMLKSRLLMARPGYGWLSEETEDDADRLSRDKVFIVDPIDGTRAFIAGEKTWSHSLAIAENGHVTAAVVYLPLRDELFSATHAGGAFLNAVPIAVSGREILEGASVLTKKQNLEPANWQGGTPPVQRHFRPSLAYRLALVAQGRFDAMLTLGNTWEWDIAAGTLIAAEAGARVTDREGNAPVFNNPHPALSGILAATGSVHAGLKDRLI